MANQSLIETLLRIEHKLDLLLKQPGVTKLASMADPLHICPVCKQQVDYNINMMEKTVSRKCGCSSGKIAPIDLSAFAPTNQERHNGERDEQETEDGIDPTRRRGYRRR